MADFSSSHTPTASTMTKWVLCLASGVTLCSIVGIDHPAAPPLHLLEIDERPDVPHEDQAFQRLHVGARGDHVHRDGDAGKYELRKSDKSSSGFLPVLLDVIFWQKSLPLPNSSRMIRTMSSACRSVLAKTSVFGTSVRPGKISGSLSLNVWIDQPNLVLGHHVAVELVGRVGQVVVEFLVFLALGAAVAVRHEYARLADQLRPVLGDFGFDAVNVVADVDAVDHGLFVGVLLHQVAVEEADRLLRSAWRSGRSGRRRSIPAPAARCCRCERWHSSTTMKSNVSMGIFGL